MSWHEIIVNLRTTSNEESEIKMFSITHAANGSDQNSNQVFHFLSNTWTVIKKNYEHVSGACAHLDDAGCCTSLGPLVCLGLSRPKLDVPIAECDCSESNYSKDMCDRLISTKKKKIEKCSI